MSNINVNQTVPLRSVAEPGTRPATLPPQTQASPNPTSANQDTVQIAPAPAAGAAKQEVSFTDNLGKSVKSIGGKLAGKVIEESLHVGLRVGTQYASNRLSQKAVTAVAQEAAIGTTKVVGIAGTKASSRLSTAVPYVAATVAAGFAVLDVKNAVEMTKDKDVSGISKALAWTTVGLDAVSVATTAANKYEVVGWTAIGLSIGTSLLAEVLK